MPTTSTPASDGPGDGLLKGSGMIAVAIGLMSVATYAYTIVAARLLGPRPFGAFAAVMGLLLVIGVAQLGLQATAARRIAADPAHVAEIERAVLRVTYLVSAGLGAVVLCLTPVINAALRLDSWKTAVVVGLTTVPMTMMGGLAGVLQGERRWRPLAWLYVSAGVPRLMLGSALLWWRPAEVWAVVGVGISFCAPVVVGLVALRGGRRTSPPVVSGEHTARRIFTETARNSHALLAFFALSNADVLLSRGVLDRHGSGLYAGGLILTKAVLFLPQFVVVIAFPSMSDEHQRRNALVRSIGLVLGLGVVGAVASWLLSDLALVFIGGNKYAEIQHRLWLFALLGMFLSAIQLLVYSVVARQARFSVYLIWAMLAIFLATGSQVHTVSRLVGTVMLIDAALFSMLLGISLWRLRTGPALEAEKAAHPR